MILSRFGAISVVHLTCAGFLLISEVSKSYVKYVLSGCYYCSVWHFNNLALHLVEYNFACSGLVTRSVACSHAPRNSFSPYLHSFSRNIKHCHPLGAERRRNAGSSHRPVPPISSSSSQGQHPTLSRDCTVLALQRGPLEDPQPSSQTHNPPVTSAAHLQD